MKLIQTLKNIWKIEDLRKRIIITFLFILVYRFGCFVVLPGIRPSDLAALHKFTDSGLMQLLDMFSGGAFSQASIFALGIMPYITASIIMQLMQGVIPAVGRWAMRWTFSSAICVWMTSSLAAG